MTEFKRGDRVRHRVSGRESTVVKVIDGNQLVSGETFVALDFQDGQAVYAKPEELERIEIKEHR